jgi:hypothetical protein
MLLQQSRHRTAVFTMSVVLAVCAGGQGSWANIIPVGPLSYRPRVECPGTPGYTELEPLMWISTAQLVVSGGWDEIMWQTFGEFGPEWAYQLAPSGALNGLLCVERYEAFDGPGACQHGGRLWSRLSGVGGVPPGETLNWFQVYREWGNSVSRGHREGDWTIDPGRREVVGGTPEDDAPFYYNEGEQFYDPNSGSWIFRDAPSDRIPDARVPHSGGIDFVTLIASWDGNYSPGNGGPGSHMVTIYGGLWWGYDYLCTPEPSALCLLVISVVMGWRRVRLPQGA